MNVQIAEAMNKAKDDADRYGILAGFASCNRALLEKGAAQELVDALYFAGAAINRWRAIAVVREAAAEPLDAAS
ncbi:hypothetical protein [Pseudoxanthomonas sp. USHLN014]|uniref:hypothetical protein n=1 Tax=Pseudoxanthomonas sp. USHLN014 TaxID=3081297 RepID=UPI00301DC5A1